VRPSRLDLDEEGLPRLFVFVIVQRLLLSSGGEVPIHLEPLAGDLLAELLFEPRFGGVRSGLALGPAAHRQLLVFRCRLDRTGNDLGPVPFARVRWWPAARRRLAEWRLRWLDPWRCATLSGCAGSARRLRVAPRRASAAAPASAGPKRPPAEAAKAFPAS